MYDGNLLWWDNPHTRTHFELYSPSVHNRPTEWPGLSTTKCLHPRDNRPAGWAYKLYDTKLTNGHPDSYIFLQIHAKLKWKYTRRQNRSVQTYTRMGQCWSSPSGGLFLLPKRQSQSIRSRSLFDVSKILCLDRIGCVSHQVACSCTVSSTLNIGQDVGQNAKRNTPRLISIKEAFEQSVAQRHITWMKTIAGAIA